jgi:hypothetical protein
MAGSGDERSKRRRLEGVIPDLLKRAVEIGVERASEAPDSIKQFVHDRKLPKEVAQLLFTQIEDTKNGILRVVANEVRDFLEHTNLASDLHKILTSVQFEVNTTIRFTPNEPGAAAAADARAERAQREGEGEAHLPKPEVKTDVFVSKRESRRRSRE